MAAVLGVVLGVVLGAGSVAGWDRWRQATAHPGSCGSLLGEPRGESVGDEEVLARAWDALTDPEVDADGELDGSRPAAGRACLLYAGRFGATAPTVVYLDLTRAGYLDLVRVLEVRVPADGRPRLATAWHPLMLGSELRWGVVLPLSGIYLAPPDTLGVRVFHGGDGYAGAAARRVGDAAFDLGVVPDRTLAPADQVPDVPAALLVDRPPEAVEGGRQVVALPVRTRENRATAVRRPFGTWIDGAGEGDEAAARTLAAALPGVQEDPRFAAAFDQAPSYPSWSADTAPAAGGRVLAVDLDGPGTAAPVVVPVPA